MTIIFAFELDARRQLPSKSALYDYDNDAINFYLLHVAKHVAYDESRKMKRTIRDQGECGLTWVTPEFINHWVTFTFLQLKQWYYIDIFPSVLWMTWIWKFIDFRYSLIFVIAKITRKVCGLQWNFLWQFFTINFPITTKAQSDPNINTTSISFKFNSIVPLLLPICLRQNQREDAVITKWIFYTMNKYQACFPSLFYPPHPA